MKIYKSLIIAILIANNFSSPLFSSAVVNYDEGWRWRHSLDFTYEHEKKEYSTREIQGKEKIRIELDGIPFNSVHHVHLSLAQSISELDRKLKTAAEAERQKSDVKGGKGKSNDTNTNPQEAYSSGKKPGNYALAAVGRLISEKNKDDPSKTELVLYINILKQGGDRKRYIFTTGVSEVKFDEYEIGNYDYRKKDDLESCYEFYKDHTDGIQFKKAHNWIEIITKYIVDNKQKLGKAAPSTISDLDDFFPNMSALQTKLKNEVDKKHKEFNVKGDALVKMVKEGALEELHEEMHLITELQAKLSVLDKIIDALPDGRFADSEKYALVRLNNVIMLNQNSQVESSTDLNVLASTLHLHSNLAVCEHCSQTISWYFKKNQKFVPFVSCWEPSSGLKDDKVASRDGYGVDSGFQTLINLKSLQESLIYPQSRILHITSDSIYPCKTPEEIIEEKRNCTPDLGPLRD